MEWMFIIIGGVLLCCIFIFIGMDGVVWVHVKEKEIQEETKCKSVKRPLRYRGNK